ncbi:ABC transporter ATP-binding protein [Candidatus Berkelbacteria bacterium]|nr:ABC transporter ATP-binding protein [Candidatus Berkelbacteria bacterium]
MSALPKTIDYSNRELLLDIWRWLKPYRWQYLWASLLRLSTDVIWLYPSYALGSIVTFLGSYQPGDSYQPIVNLMTIWIVASVYYYVGRQLAKYAAYRIGERVELDATLETVGHLFKIDLAWHERENSGNKVKRIQRGANGIHTMLDMWIDNAIEATVNFVGIVIILATIDTWISVALVVFAGCYYVASVLLARRAVLAADAVNVGDEGVSGLIYESINNIRTVKALGFSDTLFGRIRDEMRILFVRITERITRFRSRQAILDGGGQLFRLGLLIYILAGILKGQYEVGLLVIFWDYFGRLWRSVNEIAEQSQRFLLARYAVARMVAILKEPVTIEDETGKVSFPRDWQQIEVKNLSFSYGAERVLNRLSFTIRRGERLGIVGVSGAGKSTLFKLLLNEHEDYSGEILVDGLPLRSIARGSYLAQTAVVLQETEIFNFSLRDNVSIANQRRARDTKLLRQALEVAHVTDFLPRLPKGDTTLVGEKGVKLSGGEKQRVGIARAVFKEPQLLLLDEATSHLDIESEEKIQDSLHQVFQSVTAVVIAHRLTTIREMDRILVIEDGQIVDDGNFAHLMRRRGRFHELWEKQKF